MDKFLVAENPIRQGATGLFILHTLAPRCLIEAICLNDEEMDNDLSAIFDLFSFVNSDGIEEKWQLIIRQYYDHADVEDVPDNDVKQYRHMLSRAWRWFRAYLEHQDENLDLEDYGKQN